MITPRFVGKHPVKMACAMNTYSDLSKVALIERIHSLELQIQQNKREGSRHAQRMEALSLHQEELRVQNEELKAKQTRVEKI